MYTYGLNIDNQLWN